MKTILGLGAFALFLVACGGAVATTDGGTDNDGATNNDGAANNDGGVPPANGCPTSPPGENASCSAAQDQIKCEYGTNPDPSCNQLFFCNAGHWQDETTGQICAPQSDCPASYAAVPANQDCAPESLQCAYPQGVCICTTSFGGLQKTSPGWDCIPVSGGCPSPRPDIGSACSSVNQIVCDYGACSGGVGLSCKNGMWTEVETPCPG